MAKGITGTNIFTRFKGIVHEPNLKALNRALMVIAILIFLFSIADFIFQSQGLRRIYQQPQSFKLNILNEQSPGAKSRPFLHYMEMVRRRNIFSPIAISSAKGAQGVDARLAEMARDLSLVGISFDQGGAVAMIEDGAVPKTYFLKKGDKIRDFTIKDILKNHIVLGFEGKVIGLR